MQAAAATMAPDTAATPPAVREGDTGIMEPCEASIDDLADYGATTVLKGKMPLHRAEAPVSPGEAGRLHLGRRLVKIGQGLRG